MTKLSHADHSTSKVTPVILVAGGNRVGKTKLRQGILNTDVLPIPVCAALELCTRYYTAKISICEAGPETCNDYTLPEALVLVFSLVDPSSFASVQSISGEFDVGAIQIKLLCGTHADIMVPSSAAESIEIEPQSPWVQQAADWSIDNGFEFILCCPPAPAIDAKLAIDGCRQGVARVVEALQAHVWPNCDMLLSGQHDATHAVIGNACSISSEQHSRPSPSWRDTTALHGRVSQSLEMAQSRQTQSCNESSSSAPTEGMVDDLERLMDEIRGELVHGSTGRFLSSRNGEAIRNHACSLSCLCAC